MTQHGTGEQKAGDWWWKVEREAMLNRAEHWSISQITVKYNKAAGAQNKRLQMKSIFRAFYSDGFQQVFTE